MDQCRINPKLPLLGRRAEGNQWGAAWPVQLEQSPGWAAHCPEMDCSTGLGSWMLRECSAALPGHPTLQLPAWLCLSSSHTLHHQPEAFPCLLSHPKKSSRGLLIQLCVPWDAAMRQRLVLPPDTTQLLGCPSPGCFQHRKGRGVSLTLRDSLWKINLTQML